MTVYVSETNVTLRAGLPPTFNAWADDVSEMEIALYAIGADPDIAKRWDLTSWDAYTVSEAQLADLVVNGAVLTDKWGPLEHMAKRDNRTDLVAMIERNRQWRKTLAP